MARRTVENINGFVTVSRVKTPLPFLVLIMSNVGVFFVPGPPTGEEIDCTSAGPVQTRGGTGGDGRQEKRVGGTTQVKDRERGVGDGGD